MCADSYSRSDQRTWLWMSLWNLTSFFTEVCCVSFYEPSNYILAGMLMSCWTRWPWSFLLSWGQWWLTPSGAEEAALWCCSQKLIGNSTGTAWALVFELGKLMSWLVHVKKLLQNRTTGSGITQEPAFGDSCNMDQSGISLSGLKNKSPGWPYCQYKLCSPEEKEKKLTIWGKGAFL